MSEQRGWPYEPVDTRAAPAPAPSDPVALSVRSGPPAEPVEPPLPTPRPRMLAAFGVAVALALLLGAFAIFDWYSRNQELDVLLTRIARAEQSQQLPINGLNQLLRDCSMGFGVLPSECDRSAIARIAARSLPDLEATGEDVAQTRLTRHHGSIRTLRDRYVDHNLAWRAWLTSLASAESGSVDPPASIRSTFLAAGDAARDAVPPFPLHDLERRRHEIFS